MTVNDLMAELRKLQKEGRGPERLASVAVRGPDGRVWTGTHHSEIFDKIRREADIGEFMPLDGTKYERGFVTDGGRYISDRAEAMKIARASGQVKDARKPELHANNIKPGAVADSVLNVAAH